MGESTYRHRVRGKIAAASVVIAAICACTNATAPTSPPAASAPAASVDVPAGGSATSESLIGEALARGEIDYATSLLYRVYAAFGASDLPAPYRSEVIDTHAATFALKEVDQHSAELPAEVLAATAPYMARPNDPQSIFSRPGPTAQIGTDGPATPLRPVDKWVSKPAAGGKARVWTPDSPIADSLLDLYAGEVDRVWPKVFSLTREPIPDEAGAPLASVNPDTAIDLYFVDLGTIDPRVWACHTNPASPNCTSVLTERGGYTLDATPKSGRVSSSYVVIEAGAKGAELDANIAHELAHTSQNTYDRFEDMWLLDSTATWAEYRTLQLLGIKPDPEYKMLGDFFAGLDEPLTRNDDDVNRYASWLYYLSLQIDYGADQLLPTIFGKMAAEPEQGAGALDEAFRFEANFGDFAVSNWNRDTATRYRKDTQFPTSVAAAVDYTRTMDLGEEQLEFETTFLSADYASYKFTDAVRKVVIENPFTSAIAACNCVPSLWLIPKVKGMWQAPQQVTGPEKEFCFDRPDEDLDELVLVVANPAWQESSPLSTAMMPKIRALDEGCACDAGATGWTGSLFFDYDGAGGGAQVQRSADVTLTFDEVYLDEEDAKTWIGSYTGGSAQEQDSMTYPDHTDTVTGGPITRARGSLALDKLTCLFTFSFSVGVTSTFNQFGQSFDAPTTVGEINLYDLRAGAASIVFDGSVPAHVTPGEPGESDLFLVSGGQISGGYEFELEDALGEDGLGVATVRLSLTPTGP